MRQKALREQIMQMPGGRLGLFLFSEFETINNHAGDLLSVPFVNGAGKEISFKDG